MANETMIPILPCHSISDMLEFYGALGFEITYQQSRPNTYACVKRGGIDLHFFTLKDYDPAQSYSTCLVSVLDIDDLYQAFAAGLRQHYGRLPVAGIPRLTRPNNNNGAGDRRFNVIDPGGNWIRFVQKAETPAGEAETEQAPETRLGRALNTAAVLANSKGDYAAAAKLLDTALVRDEPVSAIERVRALVLRAEVALALDDRALAGKLLADVDQAALEADERVALMDELERAADLAQILG